MSLIRRVRLAITGFILVLLAVVVLGLIWTSRHQPPPARTASHIVLGVSGLAGAFALTRIWRGDRGPHGPDRS